MRPFFIMTMLLTALTSHARDWNHHWIYCQQADSVSQVWFMRSYTLRQRPEEAFVEVASSGRFILYINGYNVTTSLWEPFVDRQGDTIGVVRYDVMPFLRSGDNELKVWFSPMRNDQRQLSLQFYGSIRGVPFAYSTDPSWTCRDALCRTLPNGDEWIDGRQHILKEQPLIGWQPVAMAQCRQSMLQLVHPSEITANRSYITDYDIIDCDSLDSTRVVFRGGVSGRGILRITLRDTHRGDTLFINGLRYICRGESDEQAFRRFTTCDISEAVVQGPAWFRRDNVMSVEAITVFPVEN
ncbi:MAG: alpha-L-rhamnosidase N-terminal domain-containing protein [Prevotella sp.]|nr:alpha-L-rhamnosidase N-terminal domain-containing protein [Prevotella sp.]